MPMPKLATTTGGDTLMMHCFKCRQTTPTLAPVIIKQAKNGTPLMQGKCAAIVRKDGEADDLCAATKTKFLPRAAADA